MAYKPISNEYLQSGLQQYVQSQPAPVEEKPLWERAKDDIVNTVSNYFEGARQGINELSRAQDAQMGSPLARMVEGGDYQPPSQETNQWVADAQKNVMNETFLPALAFSPMAIPAIGTMLAGGATDSYQNTEGTPLEKAGNAVRSITYGPAVDMYNDPNLSQEFQDRPVSTLASGAMAVGQAVLPAVGARYGVKKVGEFKNDLVSRVESRLNEQLNELTDNPPLKNTGIQGLDALDQLDAPNQGFRAATKDELKQTVIEQLEQIKAQKFDKANQESYFNNMRQQELESNALQAQKNEIAGSVLMSPLDRMEVGADLPIKRTLGGQGEVLGLKPIDSIRNEIFLGEKPIPQEIIKAEQPRYSRPQERPFLPSAEQLIDRNKQNQIQQELGISRNGITARNPIFGDRGNSFPPIVKAEQPIKFEQPHQEFVKIVEDKIQSQKEAVEEKPANVLPIEEKQQLEKLLAELEGHKNAYIDEMVQYYESNPGGKGVKQGGLGFDEQGNVVTRFGRESLNPQWYQEYYSEYGNKPSKVRLREFAEKQLEGSKEAPEGHADFIEIKSMIDNIKSVISGKGKLNAGFDPTFGRFDNVDLGAKALEVTMKAKERIINGVDDGRIIDNNPKWYNKGLKNLPPVKKLMDRIYQQVFDSLDPIARYDKEVYKSARLANGSAIGKAESMIKNQNNPNSFENIVKPVQNRIDDFAEYMVAKRAKELHATGTMTGVSNAKINEILSKAPAEFADVQKQLTSYSDKLVEMLVDSGMISEEHAINMFNKYESYAPMMQAFDGEQISRMFQDKGDLGKPIKNIEGSDSKVVNPIESILKNTYTFNMIAETNKVRQQIASLAESFPDEIKILKSGESAEKGTGTFDFFVDGKKQTMQLEPRLFEAIASMDSQQAGIVVSVLSKPASWLRAGATISPEFMAKNLIRDTIGASIVGKGFVPFVDSARGLKSAWKKDADYWRYKEEGGALGHLTGLDRDYMQEMVDNYRKKSNVQKLSAVFNPKTWLDVLRKGQELSEDATRIGYYKKRLSKGDSPHEAAFEARDLLDFGRSGNYTKEANKVVAFLNASLQGSDKLARSFKERPLETAANTMKYLILPSMAVWYMQEKSGQKEQIQELPRYVRDMFWVIPTGDTLIRIPKPFEPGMLFATGTERTMEAMFGDSKTPYKGYAESLMDVNLPNLLPTGLIPLGEWWANKSFFTGQAIVPNREQDLPEAMQYGPYTTNVAKTIGEKTGQSPRKIDNAIRGLTGGMGTTVTSAIDSLTGGTGTVRPAKSLSDMPVVKAFIADPRKGQQSTQDFYDELDKYTKKHQAESMRNVKMTATEKQNYTALNNANTALKALNKEERKVLESNTLSPEAKKQKINKLVDAQSKLVQASLKRIK